MHLFCVMYGFCSFFCCVTINDSYKSKELSQKLMMHKMLHILATHCISREGMLIVWFEAGCNIIFDNVYGG